ncbi:MAG: hypothetical protein H7Z40_21770 [Phycisphaerae bacterium]|nr:hypothetical protein [Gemmatimonadaceae bacterium]
MQQNSRFSSTQTVQLSGTRQLALAGVLVVFALTAGALDASAQIRPSPVVPNQVTPSRGSAVRPIGDSIPSEYRPPAGMCRVWIDGVPAAQQPASTDCPSATLKKPANARVVWGEDPRAKGGKSSDQLPVRGFAPSSTNKRSPVNAAIPPTARVEGIGREDKRISDEQLFGDRPANSPASSYPGTSAGGQSVLYPPAAPNAPVGNGILGDPRYFNNAGVKPPGYGSGSCLDRDQDGWCDDSRFGPPACLDQDKDGRCDDLPEFASQAYPQTLPRMRSAVDVIEGRGSVEVARWIGTNEFTVRLPDQGQGGTPWRAIFLDARNELLQVWTDRNRDGLAERVEIFRNGQRVKLIQR